MAFRFRSIFLWVKNPARMAKAELGVSLHQSRFYRPGTLPGAVGQDRKAMALREETASLSLTPDIPSAAMTARHASPSIRMAASVIPLAMQQYMLLQRNLVYTGITRGKKVISHSPPIYCGGLAPVLPRGPR